MKNIEFHGGERARPVMCTAMSSIVSLSSFVDDDVVIVLPRRTALLVPSPCPPCPAAARRPTRRADTTNTNARAAMQGKLSTSTMSISATPMSPAAKRAPTYFEMVNASIIALKDRSGSSLASIIRHIKAEIKPEITPRLLNAAIKKGVAKGKLLQTRGSYKLSHAVKPKATPTKKKPPTKAANKPKVSENRTASDEHAAPARATKRARAALSHQHNGRLCAAHTATHARVHSRTTTMGARSSLVKPQAIVRRFRSRATTHTRARTRVQANRRAMRTNRFVVVVRRRSQQRSRS